MQIKQKKVKTLLDALPYIQKFRNKIIVIKYGGSAQTSKELQAKFVKDIELLTVVGIKPVIVHGGGAKITELLNKLGIESKFIDGQRVTCDESMKIVEMVLSGLINKNIVSLLNFNNVKAIGISGKDSNLFSAKPIEEGKFGYTGEIIQINEKTIIDLIEEGFVPVIAPIANGNKLNHPGFNINADNAASKIAIALKAQKIIFLTDTLGVLDRDGNLINSLTKEKVNELIKDKIISGGMIPKVNSCLECIENGVNKAHIIDGRIEHSILLELFTSDGIGTQFISKAQH